MNQLNKFETNKLHYGKYLYKLHIENPLSSIFRTEFQRGPHSARHKLDEYHQKLVDGEALTVYRWRHEEVISDNYYFDAETIYQFIQKIEDLKVRCEHTRTLILYSNDKESLLELAKSIRMGVLDFYEPDPAYENVLTNNQIVLIDDPSEWVYKCYFKCSVKSKVDSGFGKWAENNTDKIKIGPKTLEGVKNGYYLNDHYFYVKNQKILSLVQLMIGHNIRRVEKRVYKGDI